MKKIYISILAAVSLITGCEEWQPVFTLDYDNPPVQEFVSMAPTHTIAELKAMYTTGKPWKIDQQIIIAGQVTSSDKAGNLYRTFYIQDETGGIEIKIGTRSLYNEYKLGQWVYVDCEGLVLGGYRGMVNLGSEDPTKEYESSYIDVQPMIDLHIFKGEMGEPVQPKVLTEAELKDKSNLGRYVTVNGIVYDGEIFILAYIDYNKDHKDYNGNCIFIDEEFENYAGMKDGHKQFHVDTWAVSDDKWEEYLLSGIFDDVEAGGYTVKHFLNTTGISKSAYSLSQTFKVGKTPFIVRSSGYAKFADARIDQAILDGTSVSMTGILTIYDSDLQFILLDLEGVKIN